MKRQIIIETTRAGYAPEQVGRTMTVGELIAILEEFDPDTPVVTSHDRGYTYGPVRESDIHEREES